MRVSRKIQGCCLAGLMVFPLVKSTPHKNPESWYQERWCAARGGEIEVVLPDNTRCDCVTDTHAIEFDFGEKWAESIGQSLYYGMQLGKTPGVVLILEEESDEKYWDRLNATVEYYSLPIDTWSTNEDEFPEGGVLNKVSSWLLLLLGD